MGDGVWEGLRLHKGTLLFLDAPTFDRLFRGGEGGWPSTSRKLDRAALKDALRRTLEANAMTDGVHVGLMVTRGLKATVSQDPRNALGRADHRHRGRAQDPAHHYGPARTAAGDRLGALHAGLDVRHAPEQPQPPQPDHRALLEAIEAGADARP